MSFIQFPNPTPVFPVLPPLTWSVHKKPILASRSITAVTGREVKVACCAYPRWSFILSYGGNNSWLRDQTQNSTKDSRLSGLTELTQISGLFFSCQGSYGEFYYSDPDDSSRSGSYLGTGDGATMTTFLILVSWGNGPFSPGFSFPAGGIESLSAVYVNGIEVSSEYYSLNLTSNGCYVVFVSPEYAYGEVTADFSFYYRCRFLDDTMNYNQFSQNLWEVKEVRFESVKP